MSDWGRSPSPSQFIQGINEFIHYLWKSICQENKIALTLNDPISKHIYKSVKDMVFLGLLESQIRAKTIINNPNVVKEVCKDIYSGNKYGKLTIDIYEPGYHTELGRGRYFSAMVCGNTTPLPTEIEAQIPLSLGYMKEGSIGSTSVYPMALLYRYYWYGAANPKSYDNTEKTRNFILGGLKYLVSERGLTATLKLIDRSSNVNEPFEMTKTYLE